MLLEFLKYDMNEEVKPRCHVVTIVIIMRFSNVSNFENDILSQIYPCLYTKIAEQSLKLASFV